MVKIGDWCDLGLRVRWPMRFDTPMTPDLAPGTPAWRRDQCAATLRFAEAAALPGGGFGWLDGAGRVDKSRGLQLWINARMTYVFSIASLLQGRVHPLAEHGIRALDELFADPDDGGWHQQVRADGTPTATTKGCYEHAFVVLAAAAARIADIDGANRVLAAALDIHQRYFWDDAAGRCRESWSADWTETEPYRGANSNMHTVEAYLTAADATGDPVWRDRAQSICEHLIDGEARRNGWRIPEHYDADWRVDLDYNSDAPADPFRPFGATPGHGFEWARLVLAVEATLDDPPAWMLEAASALYARATADGAAGDGTLYYSTDWTGRPVVRERFHWVMAEAVAAADTLTRRTSGEVGAEQAEWWTAIDRHFVDRTNGSWHHELGDDLRVSSRTWSGKPDAYHIVNAMLLPDVPLTPSLAASLA